MTRLAPRLPALVALVPMTFLALVAVPAFAAGAQAPAPPDLPFRNPDLPLEERIDDVLSRLTLHEKVGLMIERAAAVERLGIPEFPWWSEALHGVARTGRATVFPQAIGLAATWDANLMHRVATAISDEARAMNNHWVATGRRNIYQGLVFWSPNINIFRDPRWGRGQETYGEDPFLTARMGVAFVEGMQGDHPRYLKTVATPKHYAVHNGPESTRHVFDAQASEVDLRETYLPAFRATVVEGEAGSVMCAYNRFRGDPACGSTLLLHDILRDQWGFSGYVVSDCGAVQDIYLHHKVRDSAAAGAAMALKAGTDLECSNGSWTPGSPDAFYALEDAVEQGLVEEKDLDVALRRLFRAQLLLGVYDPPDRVPWSHLRVEDVVDSPKHRELALEAARKSMVLLKNEAGTLPLSRDLGTIAVIGANADDVEVIRGNYAGTPVAPVSILAGIEKKVGASTRVVYARGGPLAEGVPDLQPVPGSALFTTSDGSRVSGLTGAYYAGHFEGAPVFTRADHTIDFDWADGAPGEGLDGDVFSVRWTGHIVAPATGTYTLAVRCANMCRLFVDDKPIGQARGDHEPALASGSLVMRAGRSYNLRVELEHSKYDAAADLLWEVPGGGTDEVAEAVEAAREADGVVLVLGLASWLEGEEMGLAIEGFHGGDRTSLELPKVQRELMRQVVAAAGEKPVVLVLVSGSALAVNWASENVPAILQAWYPGQAAGTAVADVLFGDVSPGGRLPVTFYRSVDQLPPFEDYAMKGRTYRYFTGDVLYPFGHGLSYGRFSYDRLRVSEKARVGTPLEVSVRVRNEGSMAADEVVQVYVSHPEATMPAPLRALKAFRRVSLEPGERKVVRFTLSERDLSLVSTRGDRLVEPGPLVVAVGGAQPGFTDGSTTEVVQAPVSLSGEPRGLDP
jgi:beta-glucosidase